MKKLTKFSDEFNEIKRYNFLDGYRGMLAILVLVSHSKKNDKCELVNFIYKIRHTTGVYGFFILSSFLLTYKLLNELNSSGNNAKMKLFILIKYLVRRFFRIYVVFFIIATCIKFGPKILGGVFNFKAGYKYSSWTELILLDYSGVNHLWTIAPEFKYYFFIPIYCLIINKLKRYELIILSGCIIASVLNEKINFLGLIKTDFYDKKSHYLIVRFSIFFYGTIAAHLLTLIESNEKLMRKIQLEKIQFIINYLTVILFIYGLKRNYEDEVLAGTISARIWSSLILFLRLGNQKNYLIRILSNEFLCKCGLYSFGIYLLHPIFVQTTLEFFNFSLNLDNIIVILLKSFIAGLVFYYLIESRSVKLGNILIKKTEKTFFSEIEFSNKESIV